MPPLVYPPKTAPKVPCVVGIDFGTTTCLAAWSPPQDESGRLPKPELIPLASSERPYLESVITYTQFGYQAGRYSTDNLHDATDQAVVIRSIKRVLEKISRNHSCNPNEEVWNTPQGCFNCIQIATHLFSSIRERIEKHVQQAIAGAVITVPAYFGERARSWIRQAAEQAGLRVLRLLSEPTAAALTVSPQLYDATRYVGVYDLGGGTFDCSVLSITGPVFEVLATIGNTKLGGDDFDQHIVSWLYESQGICYGTEILTLLARGMKEDLCEKEVSSIELDGKTVSLSRTEFNQWIHPSITHTIELVKNALRKASLEPEQLDSFLLVGGSTKIPYVVQMLSECIPLNKLVTIPQPQTAVALGAAIHARSLVQHADNLLLLDVNPFPLGLETFGGEVEVLIPANSLLPAVATKRFRLGHSKQQSVEIHIVQADHEQAHQCTSLGRFLLSRNTDPESARSLDTISVTFSLDIDSVLTVSAALIDGPERASFSVQLLTEQGIN